MAESFSDGPIRPTVRRDVLDQARMASTGFMLWSDGPSRSAQLIGGAANLDFRGNEWAMQWLAAANRGFVSETSKFQACMLAPELS